MGVARLIHQTTRALQRICRRISVCPLPNNETWRLTTETCRAHLVWTSGTIHAKSQGLSLRNNVLSGLSLDCVCFLSCSAHIQPHFAAPSYLSDHSYNSRITAGCQSLLHQASDHARLKDPFQSTHPIGCHLNSRTEGISPARNSRKGELHEVVLGMKSLG
jgi:hypothetical protein